MLLPTDMSKDFSGFPSCGKSGELLFQRQSGVHPSIRTSLRREAVSQRGESQSLNLPGAREEAKKRSEGSAAQHQYFSNILLATRMSQA
ncbi:unnamed protein product [Cylicocyclus nassatus]|uniref:Uncharacterized protein n=1 Tax=Cylicocyclus nassatus TaxID=53992 RepID=A0AA36M6S6_CYLNA|nr:unnamed protein product [Cylicocyclus nassatus]